MAKPEYLQTRIFLDSGNPEKTSLIKQQLGFLDGQTTNPSLVAKNPTIVSLKELNKLTVQTIWEEYKKIALEIHARIPEGAISVEVFADMHTLYDVMLEKAHELATWFPGIFVKLPITHTGLAVAQTLVREGINVNMTLCFSQQQAAAVHMATLGAQKGQVFISPFVGRLDDIGKNGIDLIKNITIMYRSWGSHVLVLGASVRSEHHIKELVRIPADCLTAPEDVLSSWKENSMNDNPAQIQAELTNISAIPFVDIQQQDWELYDIEHELTRKGLEKFVTDWNGLFT